MEPRVFTRGNILVPCGLRRGASGFNGATRVHAWKLDSERQVNVTFWASMEPRVFTRGNDAVPFSTDGLISCFNGATRVHAWKPGQWYWVKEPKYQLQWSHACSRVETIAVNVPITDEIMASMEPRVFTRGNINWLI